MSFPRYATYKDSGVEWLGEVPEHWSVRRIGAIFRQVDEEGEEDLAILSVSIHDGVSDKELDEKKMDRKVTRSDDRSKYKKVRPGDLVYNMMRAWQGGFGSVTVEGMVSPAYVVARPISDFSTPFVEQLLRTPQAIEQMRRHSQGVTDFRLRLYWEEFKAMRIVLPPSNEQTAIAEFLDRETAKIDALVGEQRRLIELLKEKRQAVISHAVTKGLNPHAAMKPSGIEWLGDVPEHWQTKKLNYLLSEPTKNGISPEITADGTTPTFSIAAVRNGTVDIQNHLKYASIDLRNALPYTVKKQDILVLRGNGNKELVGTAGIVVKAPPNNCIYPDILIRIRPNCLVESWYLVACLNSIALRPQIETVAQTASGVWKISGGSLQAIHLPLPPLEEQQAIERHLQIEFSTLDALTAEAQRAIDLLQERRTALISAAVTGKIDVRGLAESEAA